MSILQHKKKDSQNSDTVEAGSLLPNASVISRRWSSQIHEKITFAADSGHV
jgi:hypothetical protein